MAQTDVSCLDPVFVKYIAMDTRITIATFVVWIIRYIYYTGVCTYNIHWVPIILSPVDTMTSHCSVMRS